MVGAHPRSRGENQRVGMCAFRSAGSSPLTRRKLRSIQAACAPDRLIPAHAGKTQKCLAKRPPETAHPRSRGENVRPSQRPVSYRGSSPLTRGKHASRPLKRPSTRLIPAHAGKTFGHNNMCDSIPAHPRSRGENGIELGEVQVHAGSSPLTRGKLPGMRRP